MQKNETFDLKDLKIVEKTIEEYDDSIISFKTLKKILKDFDEKTLKEIISYLKENKKIVTSTKGITWVYTDNDKLKRIASGRSEI